MKLYVITRMWSAETDKGQMICAVSSSRAAAIREAERLARVYDDSNGIWVRVPVGDRLPFVRRIKFAADVGQSMMTIVVEAFDDLAPPLESLAEASE